MIQIILPKSGRYFFQLKHFNMPFLHTCLETSLPFAIIKNDYNFQDPCHGSSNQDTSFSCNVPFLPKFFFSICQIRAHSP